jgi:hypothetical protein
MFLSLTFICIHFKPRSASAKARSIKPQRASAKARSIKQWPTL